MFDLDAARAERPEVVRVFKYQGREWSCPWSPPIIFAQQLARGDITEAIATLVGEENAAELLAAGFEIDDLQLVLSALYGMSSGE